MHKVAMMGACTASTVALNVAMQQFSWGTEDEENSGNNSEDDDYPTPLLVNNTNFQYVALVCAEERIDCSEVCDVVTNHLGKPDSKPTQWWGLFIGKHGNEEPEKWRALFRVSRPTFDYICNLVRQDMETFQNLTTFLHEKGQDITVEKQVAIALRRLSSGDPLSSVGKLFGVENSIVSKITWRFIKSIVDRARHHLKWPEGEQMERVKSAFEQLTGFRNCCGVVGSTHFQMCFPPEEFASQWVDRTRNVSMVSQAIVDTGLRFLDVCIGWPGASEDAVVLQNSTFYRLCETGERLNGRASLMLGRPIPEYILGSSGYPLLPWLATPYPEGIITQDGKFIERTPVQSAFNERHEATRVAVDKAFACLKGVWRILHRKKQHPNSPKLSSLVFGCCLLHNILVDKGESIDQDAVRAQHHDHGYFPVYSEQNAHSDGWKVRDILSAHLSGLDPSRNFVPQ